MIDVSLSLGERIIVVVLLLELLVTIATLAGVLFSRMANQRVQRWSALASEQLSEWFPRVLMGDKTAVAPDALLMKLPVLRARMLLTELGERVADEDRLPLREMYLRLGFDKRPKARGLWERLVAVREARALRDPSGELRQLLDDPQGEVRVAAFEALCELGRGAEALEGLDAVARDSRSSRLRAVDAIERAGLAETLVLAQSLSSCSETRQVAIGALSSQISPVAVARLVEALDDPEFEVRLQSLRGLHRLGDRSVVGACIARLKDAAWEVRLEAVRTIAALGGEQAAPAIAAGLADEQEWVRHQTAHSLAACGPTGRTILQEAATLGHRNAKSVLTEAPAS